MHILQINKININKHTSLSEEDHQMHEHNEWMLAFSTLLQAEVVAGKLQSGINNLRLRNNPENISKSKQILYSIKR